MKAYNTIQGIVILYKDSYYLMSKHWDEFVNDDNIYDNTILTIQNLEPLSQGEELLDDELLAPIGNQEIWASGVTYYRSREARIEESKDAGGGDFYDRVYHADRPELFFKSPSYRAVGPFDDVRIRKDSVWNVPEPELTLAITSNGEIIGYTIGNDMSSRDIEGENPLYLPQAKTYDKSAAVGPCLFLTKEELSKEVKIHLEIKRSDAIVFRDQTDIGQIKRSFSSLVDYLFRETSFPNGVLLMTGTGIVPPDEFTLQSKDEIRITIDPIGTLINTVE